MVSPAASQERCLLEVKLSGSVFCSVCALGCVLTEYSHLNERGHNHVQCVLMSAMLETIYLLCIVSAL